MTFKFNPVFGIGLEKESISAFGILRRGLKPQSKTTGCQIRAIDFLANMRPFIFISPEKTPGSAGGLTEFDSSGNMFLKLASAVQIGCPLHDEYLPRMHHLSEIW